MSRKKKTGVVCWIPIGIDGEAMLDDILPGDIPAHIGGNDKFPLVDDGKLPRDGLPTSIADKSSLLAVNPITILKMNDQICFWIVQGGVLVRICIDFPPVP